MRCTTQAGSMTRLMERIGGQAGTFSRGAWNKIKKKPGGGFESRAKNTRDLELRSGTAIKVMKPETDERDSIVGQKQGHVRVSSLEHDNFEFEKKCKINECGPSLEREEISDTEVEGKTSTGIRYEAEMEGEENAKVYEGGEEDNSASKIGAGGYEDGTTAMEKYEAIQSRDDYEEGDAAGEDEEVIRS